MKLRTSSVVVILLAFTLLFSAQCGKDDPTAPEQSPPPLSSVSKAIDQNGGEVRLDNEAWIIIPPGALDTALVVTITKVPIPINPPANYVPRAAEYHFTPYLYTFSARCTIGVAFDTTSTSGAPAMTNRPDDTQIFWNNISSVAYGDGSAMCYPSMLGIYTVFGFRPLEEVYVSTSSRGWHATGTRDDPLPSVYDGILASHGAGDPYPQVLVAAGTYQGGVTFLEGVSVQGGLDGETWEFSAGPLSYSIVELGRYPALAEEVTVPTTIAGLVLSAGNGTAQYPTSIAFRADSCREGLRFVNCRFIAGNGFNGAPGDSGVAGLSGGDGNPAGTGYNDYQWRGGAGGTGNSFHRGGKGGDGVFVGCGFIGNAGYGTACGGLGGAGACFPNPSWVGGYGVSGLNGANGTGGTNHHEGANSGWSPVYADSSARDGAPGCGGGGGGGGSFVSGGGMGGGGGGGGGLGGEPGLGGGGGGSSFAVYLWYSSPTFVNCEFITGDGGHGGEGGKGGTGGEGGDGGLSHGSTNVYIIGGAGGAGGKGGFGGSGGGGAGGHSFCVWRVGAICLNADFSACRIWDWHPGAFGLGGDGGQASNHKSEGLQAARGAHGNSGLIGP